MASWYTGWSATVEYRVLVRGWCTYYGGRDVIIINMLMVHFKFDKADQPQAHGAGPPKNIYLSSPFRANSRLNHSLHL